VREFAARGAQLLVNITNDGWYGRTSAPYQHFAMAKFRAVENERFLVRAANTGITAVVDPHGRVLERTELFERTVLVREVPLLAGSTFYTRHGDVFAWACLGAAVALTAAGLKSASRPPRRPGRGSVFRSITPCPSSVEVAAPARGRSSGRQRAARAG
jgi:apolipoprotein N-acyltransferase